MRSIPNLEIEVKIVVVGCAPYVSQALVITKQAILSEINAVNVITE